jgi:hypothetical protein
MTTIRMPRGFLTVTPDFKPGDPEPVGAGYLDWHAWAEVQHKAGIKPTPRPEKTNPTERDTEA